MNPDRFTLKTREAIPAAQSLAEERRHPQVTPEHLLSVLLEQDEPIVSPLLRKVGADAAGIRREVNGALDGLPRLGARPESTGASDELGQVLRAADRERRDLKDDYVSVEHPLPSPAAHRPKARGAPRPPAARHE